ncbi:ABC transporter permease [Streptomonospora wellingtoniae]|uniref:ABC transporter permease n=1 Tax=Streptomonospora wellingtoniae TaxID=3075544 RepID=A0ABU2KTF1_9ACTN|nr:ABC transporter permease [Streptomonospora sp. DSM 45055]MDT0302486.1 ABC transporter permease [Streptomonospora sp. DSM 45055]
MTQFASEVRKVATTWTWWVVLLGMVAYSACYTAFMVIASRLERSPLDLGSAESAVIVYNMPVAIAYVFPLAMGVVLVTQEYRSKLISQTLLANPSRWSVYGAKAVTGLAVGLLYGLVTVLACTGAAGGLLAAMGEPAYLGSGPVLQAVLGSVAVLTLWGLIGVGVGALIRNQLVAVVGVVVLTQFIEPVFRLAGTGLGGDDVTWLLPGGAGDAAAGGTALNTMTGTAAGGQLPGFAMLGVYAAVFGALGAWRFARYEIS